MSPFSPPRLRALLKNQPLSAPEGGPVNGKKLNLSWRTGLLLLSSAALGGIAVALWDRSALQSLRHRLEEPADLALQGQDRDPESSG